MNSVVDAYETPLEKGDFVIAPVRMSRNEGRASAGIVMNITPDKLLRIVTHDSRIVLVYPQDVVWIPKVGLPHAVTTTLLGHLNTVQ